MNWKVCKWEIALYLSVIKSERVTQLLINPIIRARTRHFSGVYQPTRHNMFDIPFYPEDRVSGFLKNVSNVLSDNNVWEPLVENTCLRYDRLLTALSQREEFASPVPAVQAAYSTRRSVARLRPPGAGEPSKYKVLWTLVKFTMAQCTSLQTDCINLDTHQLQLILSAIARKDEWRDIAGVKSRTKCLRWRHM
jgi:hypothetical protein